MYDLLKEAFVVGLLTVVFGSLVSYSFKGMVPEGCQDWNKNFVMEISLFFTGFFIHLFCEFAGINKWYCVNGVACR